MTKAELLLELAGARANVARTCSAIDAFDAAPGNNVFESMDHAEGILEDLLRSKAFEDCEGAGNCGNDSYSQEFIVDGVHYIGTLELEYNRHDKTYYYIDDSKWSVKLKE